MYVQGKDARAENLVNIDHYLGHVVAARHLRPFAATSEVRGFSDSRLGLRGNLSPEVSVEHRSTRP